MMLGIWKNFEELEESVTLDELNLLLKAAHEARHKDHRFAAALKGIDIDKDERENRFEQIQKRANARLAGKTVEQMELEDAGFGFETS
jgi:hypothetical protein